MPVYHVSLKPTTVYGKDVVVEAESMSEAVKIARANHCGKEQVEVSYMAEWVEPRPPEADNDPDWELYEYSHQIYGDCDDCGTVLFESHGTRNPDNDWPWQHDAGDTRHHTYICYPCAMKRKEEKNYCPFFKHFYRSYKEGCDKCPEGGCNQLRERVKQRLQRALSFSDAPPTAVNHFLESGNLKLAYETLRESGTSHSRDTFEPLMLEAKELLDGGWI